MKFLLWISILCLTVNLYAQDLYIYKLFNGRFQAPFTATPEVSDLGLGVIQYHYTDKKNDVTFVSKKLSYGSALEKDIGVYRKKDIDEMITYPLNHSEEHRLITFDSNKHGKNYAYTLLEKITIEEGVIYHSVVGLSSQKDIYTWEMFHKDLNKKDIFLNNFQNVKIINQWLAQSNNEKTPTELGATPRGCISTLL